MRINSAQSNLNKKTNFTANYREVYDKVTRHTLYRNNSCFFRKDLVWDKFVDLLEKKYKNVDKVNIHCFACSDGSEPFSLAMMLIEKLGYKKAQKFFPIIASDMDSEILREPKKGIINISDIDLEHIEQNLGTNYKKYMTLSEDAVYSTKLGAKVRTGIIDPIILSSVKFKNYVMQTRIVDVPKRNSVLMSRNVWPYFERPYQKDDSLGFKMLEKASNQLGDNSLIVIGDFDNRITGDRLKAKGFFGTEVDWVYTKGYVPKEYFQDKYFFGNDYYMKLGNYKKVK